MAKPSDHIDETDLEEELAVEFDDEFLATLSGMTLEEYRAMKAKMDPKPLRYMDADGNLYVGGELVTDQNRDEHMREIGVVAYGGTITGRYPMHIHQARTADLNYDPGPHIGITTGVPKPDWADDAAAGRYIGSIVGPNLVHAQDVADRRRSLEASPYRIVHEPSGHSTIAYRGTNPDLLLVDEHGVPYAGEYKTVEATRGFSKSSMQLAYRALLEMDFSHLEDRLPYWDREEPKHRAYEPAKGSARAKILRKRQLAKANRKASRKGS